jgi:ribosome recycling factor
MREVLKDAEDRMKKVLTSLDKEFSRLRTGRASNSLLDGVRVDYYGTPTPLDQIASISPPDSRTITSQPWAPKAVDGKIIRISIPPLTEERRKDLAKVAKKYTEDAKVAVRNIRRDANEALKKLKNDKKIAEDEMHKGQEDVQKLTDGYIAKADEALVKKDKEIMEI